MSLSIYNDEYFMKMALREAEKARTRGEVPVGAVIVLDNQIIAKGHNQTEMLCDVTAHAELIAITAAANHIGSKFLEKCKVYVSLEPCIMCAGALHWARPAALIYGAADPKRGFMKYGKEILHVSTRLEYGVYHEEASRLLRDFFIERRSLHKNRKV